jgi:hypothetical protein
MTKVFVMFSGPDKTKVQTAFCCPQDPDVYPNQGEIEETDPRYLAFLNPQPSLGDLISAAKEKVRLARSSVFISLAGIQSQAIADDDMDTAKQISAVQNKLKALPDTDLSACKSEADIEMAFLVAWKTIVDSAPEGVQSAFNGVFA